MAKAKSKRSRKSARRIIARKQKARKAKGLGGIDEMKRDANQAKSVAAQGNCTYAMRYLVNAAVYDGHSQAEITSSPKPSSELRDAQKAVFAACQFTPK